MNILLCMPSGPYQLTGWNAPPIGIAYVSSCLKAAGHKVYCLNFMTESRTVREALEQMLADVKIDMVGVGDLVVNYTFMKEIVDTVKDISPETITFIGGGFVTYSPKESLELIPSADYGIIGEGEITTCEFAAAIEKGNAVSDIPGIVYRNEKGKILITGERAEMPDLEAIPFPDYDGFGLGEILKGGSAAVVTSRSCPFSCTFCSHSGGKKFRQRSLDSVFSEIDFLVKKYSVKRILLNDELFSTNMTRVKEFCDRIKKYALQWYVFLRVSDDLTTEIMTEMREAGCVLIFYGLESADNTILKSMNKRITIKQIEQTLKRTKEAGVEARGNFIFGDVEETLETAENTLKWVRGHSELLQYIKLAPIILYPGSPLYDDAVKNGLIKDTVDYIKNGCVPFNVSKMTDDEYDKLIYEILPQEQSRLLEQQKILSFECIETIDGEKYKILWRCPECSEINSEEFNPMDIYVAKKHEITCKTCNETVSANPSFEYIDWIEPELAKMLESKKCAIWGTGWFLMHSFDRLKVFTEPNASFVLCDRSISKQNNLFAGRKVYSPEILREKGIEVCVIASAYVKEIKEEISIKYPHVLAVGFHELGFDSLSRR